MRILLLFLVLITIFCLVKRLFFKPSDNKVKINATQVNGAEVLVQCAHCQAYLPKSTATHSNKQFYCSQDHANKG